MTKNRFTRRLKDSFQNLIANLNSSKDKQYHSTFVHRNLSYNDFENMYTSDWLAGKIVDIPVEDMLRNWRFITTPSISPEQADIIDRKESQLLVQPKFIQGNKWARLYGGAAIVLGVDGVGDMSEPLDPERVKKDSLRFMHVLDRRYIRVTAVNDIDPSEPNFRMPEFYQVTGSTKHIHWTRVIPFDGIDVPWTIRKNNNYWGLSVLQRVYDAVHNVATISTSTASLVYESSIGVMKVPHLIDELAAGNEDKISERFAAADAMKSINNMMVIDTEEDYSIHNRAFSALPELFTKYLNIAAGAGDIPATRLLGQSADGMNATGEGDERNYADKISSMQETLLREQLNRFDEVFVRSCLGSMPEDWSFEYNPIFQMGSDDIAKMEVDRASRDEKYKAMGVINNVIIAEQLKEDKTYTAIDVEFIKSLDATLAEANPEPQVLGSEGIEEPDDDDSDDADPEESKE